MSTPTLRRALIAATAVALFASGCSTAAPPVASAPDAEAGALGEHVVSRTMGEGMGSDEPDGAFPRTVAHYAGSTAIDAVPERIAVVSTGQLDALLALGTVPVAATRAEASALMPAYLAEAFPEQAEALDGIEDIGERTEPSLEAIAASEPDLILINSVRGAELFERLSAIAPTVVTLGNGVNWKSDFLLLADALGMEEDAQDVLDGLHRDADAFAAGLDGAPSVSFLQSAGLRMRIMGLPSFTGGIAEDLGLDRPESQRFDETSQDLSPEQLQAADADWLFYAVEGDGAAALLEAPLWPSLAAVQSGRAVEVDLDPFFMNAGPVAARLAQDRIVDALG